MTRSLHPPKRPRNLRKGLRVLADGTMQTWVKPFGARKGYWSPRMKDRVPKRY